MKKAQTGDRAAFDQLAESATDVVLASIRRRIGPELREKLEAEDVLQETFLRAFGSIKRLHGGDGEKSFERWLSGNRDQLDPELGVRRYGLRKHLHIVRDPQATGVSPSRHQRREERLSRLERSQSTS